MVTFIEWYGYTIIGLGLLLAGLSVRHWLMNRGKKDALPRQISTSGYAEVHFGRAYHISGARPWFWSIILYDGHPYHVSPTFETLEETTEDFRAGGAERVAKAERAVRSALESRT